MSAKASKKPGFPGAENFLPPKRTYLNLAKASQNCRGCDLYKNATQAVFGEGGLKSSVIFLGEQPGNSEDLEGHPFIGPAGKLLDKALAECGIDRRKIYLTNAVKHFKFERKGKLRKHSKPTPAEVHACRAWLEEEIRLIKPEFLICLGATAAQTVFGKSVTIKSLRGEFQSSPLCEKTFVTIHPSALLRSPDEESRKKDWNLFLRDLKIIKKEIT